MHGSVAPRPAQATARPREPFAELTAPAEVLGHGLIAAFEEVQAACRQAFARAARWYRQRRTMRELQELDDHVLKDIGLSRAAIREVVASLD